MSPNREPAAAPEDSVLARIVADLRASLPERRIAKPESILEGLGRARPAPRDFIGVLKQPGLGVIAEVKRGSPSKGAFAPDLDAAAAARAYREIGAMAISVLTSKDFFASDDDLAAVADALEQDEADGGPAAPPLIRKEFHVDRYQLLEARACGADAFLLIVKTLGPGPLRELIAEGAALGMTAFVEVTDPPELEAALEAGAPAIGINNRDLHTFREDLGATERLRRLIPGGIPVVAASGVRSFADMQRMRDAGVDAVLIGEALSTAADPAAKMRELLNGA